MLTTSFASLLQLRVPLQVAPLPFHGAPDLAVAVADAGGLGMVGMPLYSPDAVVDLLDGMTARTSGALGANFLMPFLDRACLEAAAPRVRVIEFFYGEPEAELVATAHAAGAYVGWQVGSLAEATAAERAGCDFVVAQGVEAGGHVRGRVGLLSLLGEVLEAVHCPVVAAGGIGGPRQLAAVLAAGAAGARMGTRFLAASEANVHPVYRQLLLDARAEDTVLTEAFSTMWPNAPHRVLRSSVAAAAAFDGEVVGDLPIPGGTFSIPRNGVASPTRETSGAIEAMALYAGESVSAVRRVQPAAEIVREVVEGAVALLSGVTRRE